jgi:SAM-dependent methyltransferase
MYSSAAEVYDLIHTSYKDYAAEAAELASLIRESHPRAQAILDVACGTAEHARRLTVDHRFQVDALDINPEFVRLARTKLPHGRVFEADMMSFDVPGRYDVILCLFSSIGYAGTLENVERTLMRFRAHLSPRGVVLVEPWFAPGVLEPGRITSRLAEAGGVSVCRMSYTSVSGRVSRSHFEYLIGRDSGIQHVRELHELGLFTTDEMLECFRRAGLVAMHDPKGPYGRGLFIARPFAQSSAPPPA